MPVICDATSEPDLEAVRELFREYQAAIGVDLCFQGFDEELATLPGAYSRPSGRLLLAVDGRSILGCVGLRPLNGTDCEMKRLYVRRAGRGVGVGRLLVTTVLDEARRIGYRRVLLDTLPSMSDAIGLYRSLGFTDTAPYCHNPVAGALYLELALQEGLHVAGYSGTPLSKKLGIKEHSRVHAVGAPDGYRRLLEPLPRSVDFVSKADRSTDIVHVFCTTKSELSKKLAIFRARLGPDAAVWVSWPKKSAKVPSEVTEDVVREVAIPLGFVDVKVCAIDEVWSGLKLVVRKELR